MTDQVTQPEPTDAAPASLSSRPKNPKLRYYVVHTYSMFEEKAKSTLLDRIKMNKMEERFGEIIVPKTASETILKSGKKKKVERNAFPGYIIVEMEMDEITNHLVRETPKITGFVGNQRTPRPISDQEVLRLTSPETVQQQSNQAAAALSFEKGETVKVIDGAFTNFDGIVDAVQSDKMKLRILVSIFGRETPVELDYGQVQKTK
jgi:transcriptional antiterminator NusG